MSFAVCLFFVAKGAVQFCKSSEKLAFRVRVRIICLHSGVFDTAAFRYTVRYLSDYCSGVDAAVSRPAAALRQLHDSTQCHHVYTVRAQVVSLSHYPHSILCNCPAMPGRAAVNMGISMGFPCVGYGMGMRTVVNPRGPVGILWRFSNDCEIKRKRVKHAINVVVAV